MSSSPKLFTTIRSSPALARVSQKQSKRQPFVPSPSRSPVHLPPRILDASFSKTFRLRLYIGQPETASSSSRSLITRVVQATGCCEFKTANKSFEARCGKGALTNQLATNWGHRRFPHPHTTMACASAPNGSHDLSPRRSDPCNGFRRKVSYQPNRASEIRPTTRGGSTAENRLGAVTVVARYWRTST